MVEDITVARKLVSICNSAASRDLDFNLTFRTVKRLLTQEKCYFTGEEFVEDLNVDNSRTFDRLDNNKGYVEGNVVACTRRINESKGNLTIQDLKDIMKGLKKKKLI